MAKFFIKRFLPNYWFIWRMTILCVVFGGQYRHTDSSSWSVVWLVIRTCAFTTTRLFIFEWWLIWDWIGDDVLFWVVLSVLYELHYKIIKFYFMINCKDLYLWEILSTLLRLLFFSLFDWLGNLLHC